MASMIEGFNNIFPPGSTGPAGPAGGTGPTGPTGPNLSGPAGGTLTGTYPNPGLAAASTDLSDSANLARLNTENAFTKNQSIAMEATGVGLSITGVYSNLFLQAGALRVVNVGGVNIDGSLTVATGLQLYPSGASITFYQGLATAGYGVPAIFASGRQVAVSAAAASAIATFTPAVDGTFLVSGNVLVTTAGTIAATMTVTYTDEGGTSRTATLPFTLVAGTPLTAIAFANGAVPYEGLPLRIRAKGGTAITVQTAGTFTNAVYNCEADIIQVR